MRVVGGKLRSRPLVGPKSNTVRPTTDRMREALFNILAHSYGDPITGARVLDLFAGTGALGIEAMSRGAAYTLFVDEGVEARALLRNNIETLGLGGVTRIFRRDATRWQLAWRCRRITTCVASVRAYRLQDQRMADCRGRILASEAKRRRSQGHSLPVEHTLGCPYGGPL